MVRQATPFRRQFPVFLDPGFRRPMSLVSSIFGSDDDVEILDALYTIVNVS